MAAISSPLRNDSTFSDFSTIDTPLSPLLSSEIRVIIEIVVFVFICSILSMLGIVANIINIIIFYRQGFSSTVNISFFFMAISDLCCLVTLQWLCLCMNPLFYNSGISFVAREIQYPTAGVTTVCFSRITSWITAFVTVERCLGITVPLKVKQIITPRRTAVTLCLCYLINFLAFTPEYLISYFDWKFYEAKNKSLVGIVYKENVGLMSLIIFISTPALSMLSFATVIAFTALLVFKLRRKSKWRKSATSDKMQARSMSVKEKSTISMVIAIACTLIVCYTPGGMVAMVTLFEPEFRILGAYENLFIVMWSFPCVFQAVNSSINIVFYYKMSTNYRQAFHQLFNGRTNIKNSTKR